MPAATFTGVTIQTPACVPFGQIVNALSSVPQQVHFSTSEEGRRALVCVRSTFSADRSPFDRTEFTTLKHLVKTEKKMASGFLYTDRLARMTNSTAGFSSSKTTVESLQSAGPRERWWPDGYDLSSAAFSGFVDESYLPDGSLRRASQYPTAPSPRLNAHSSSNSHDVMQLVDAFGSRPNTSARSDSPSQLQEEKPVGGYNVEFVNPLKEKHRCPVCFFALKEPVQTPCGHRFCRSCMERHLRGPNPTCPLDRQELDGMFPDNYCRREVLQLQVKCTNLKDGCDWRGSLGDLEKHTTTCEFSSVLCDNHSRGCTERIARRSLEQHLQHECLYRDIICDTCREKIPAFQLKEHIRDVCPETMKSCPQGCGSFVVRKELQEHMKKKCAKAILSCPFESQGCLFKGAPQVMEEHCERAKTQHLCLASMGLRNGKDTLSELRQVVDEQNKTIDNLMARCSQLENSLTVGADADDRRLKHLQEQIDRALAEKLSQGGNVELGQIEATVLSCEESVSALQKKVNEVANEQRKVAQETQKTLSQVDQDDLRLLAIETASYDGCLIWKVEHVQKIMADAKSGVKVSLYSPPFYTSRHGYKACARIYPNGDGSGRNHYLSLFFVIMANEYDNLLQWPFHQRVTLTLLDQSPNRRHLSETFMPDARSSSFVKPKTGMNVASGCPQFVSQEVLLSHAKSYVKDDTMFFKIRIHCQDLQSP